MLARPDLAEQGLEGLVRASAYRAVKPMHGRVAVADIHGAADAGSDRVDQLLYGEAFDVLDIQGEFVWGRARRDGVVGWVLREQLSAGVPLPTHRVSAVDAALPLNALVHHGWSGVSNDDLVEVGDFEANPVSVAERLLGVSHALGARSSRATDCSGLVQQALYACGLAGPRHSDQQAELGEAVAAAEARRGDIVVWLNVASGRSWTGHSGLMLDTERLIHATGHHGKVVIEDMGEADARYRADGFDAPVFRRISG